MATKKRKIVLVPHVTMSKILYKVTHVENSLEFTPGIVISKDEAARLCRLPQWHVVIKED